MCWRTRPSRGSTSSPAAICSSTSSRRRSSVSRRCSASRCVRAVSCCWVARKISVRARPASPWWRRPSASGGATGRMARPAPTRALRRSSPTPRAATLPRPARLTRAVPSSGAAALRARGSPGGRPGPLPAFARPDRPLSAACAGRCHPGSPGRGAACPARTAARRAGRGPRARTGAACVTKPRRPTWTSAPVARRRRGAVPGLLHRTRSSHGAARPSRQGA